MVDQLLDVALRKSVRRTKVHDGYFEDQYTKILKQSKEVIILDVGGTRFDVLKSTFALWPTTRLHGSIFLYLNYLVLLELLQYLFYFYLIWRSWIL